MIKGKHVTLRPMEHDDIEQIRQWRNSPHNAKHFAARDPISPEQQEKWFEAKSKSDQFLFLIILENNTQKRIGLTHLENINLKHRHDGWGIYIGELEYRKGIYATEATELILSYGFDYLNLNKIYGNTLPHNERGRRFHKRLGFNEEATFKNHYFLDGQYTDLIWIAQFQSDWKRRENTPKIHHEIYRKLKPTLSPAN